MKQRLIGAAVLVALAVIFLPLLIKGPAPDSGVSDVPLSVPAAPAGDYQTRDLPLVAPGDLPPGGATGMPSAQARSAPSPAPANDSLPTIDTATATRSPDAADLATPATPETMLPASVAGGDYVVHFGAYGSSVSADTVVSRLRAANLPAFRESASVDGKAAWRVRVGPYATRADAETARLRANVVGKQTGSRVIALDADTPIPTNASKPVASTPASPQITPQPLPPVPASTLSKPISNTQAPLATQKPATSATPSATPPPAATTPAAAGIGFAVQIGAFASSDQATKKRDTLRAAGFSAFTETVKTDKGTLTRVLAGPVVTRAAADQLKAQLKSKTGTDGMVRSHP